MPILKVATRSGLQWLRILMTFITGRDFPRAIKLASSNRKCLDEFSEGGGDAGGSSLFAYLLEDWYPEVDKEQEKEEIEEEADTEREEEEAVKEGDELQEEDEAIKQGDEEQTDASYGDFLNHFPAVRKFIEKKQSQVRSI
jgi:hypothetical protein